MEDDLKKLEDELSLIDLRKDEKEKITNIYKSWRNCLSNQIMITDIVNKSKRSNVIINNSVYIDGIKIYDNITTRSTLFFSNCKNLYIILLGKVKHVIIENSKNIIFKSTCGIIGGIDVLHSKNINFYIIGQDIYYMSFGEVNACNTYIDKSLALNTLISTLHCNKINFVHLIDEILENKKYITNNSLFSGLYMMMFLKNNSDNVLELHYVYQDNENKNKGIIYPTDK